MTLQQVGIIGTGLIGTSIGLALARVDRTALLVDQSAGRAAAAEALGAGRAVTLRQLVDCDHIVLAVPPSAVSQAITAAFSLNVDCSFSDVASVKTKVMHDIELLEVDTSRFCGGHPIAGRERGGPGAAQAELFDHAVWAVTPHSGTGDHAVEDVTTLAALCGARPVKVSAGEHDAILAVVSHAPQLAASALAAALTDTGGLGPVLAGTGFRDTTRLADGDPDLWSDIAMSNGEILSGVLRSLAGQLGSTASALEHGNHRAVRDLLVAGNAARALLPGKANAARRPTWARVGVVLADRPGELARLLTAAGTAGVNVEDLTIEHAVDHPVGFVDLEIRADRAEVLLSALGAAGWAAHRTR
ncbi:MAG TPA: prephenate dehydrogenase [Mycobacteriales bacterium]|nr:prephenate dehydrogenase [Mycobacteriales bacterium]